MTLVQPFEPDDNEAQRQRADLRESFIRFLKENYSKILNFLLRQCFDRHLAEDALHEALIVAMDKWETMSKREKPLYWVRMIARNKLFTLDGQQKWKDTIPLQNIPNDIVEPTSSREAEMVLRYVLSQLPANHRAVLALMVDGDNDEQIALQTGLTVKTVRTYKTQVRKKYRELFQEGDEGGRHGSQ